MKSRHKLRAFTITEIAVVLVISAIVVGLAFSVLSVVQKNIGSITINYEQKTALSQLEQALTIAFNTYTEVYWEEEESRLILRSPIAQTSYQFYADSIVADKHVFNVQLHEKQLYFRGETVVEGRIDAVALNFSKTNNFQHIFIAQYDDLIDDFDN